MTNLHPPLPLPTPRSSNLGAATQTFCSSSNPTIANLVATGSNIQWYDAATAGNLLAGTTALVNGTHYFASEARTGGVRGTRQDVSVVVNTIPAGITGGASQ